MLDAAGKPVVDKYISHFQSLSRADSNDGDANLGLGLCYLQLKAYPLAIRHLEKAVELMPNVPDTYYYYGLSLLKGKRPRTLSLNDIRGIEELIDTARQLDTNAGKYDFLASIIKNDYYKRNGLKMPPPTDEELLELAKSKRYDVDEIRLLMRSCGLSEDKANNWVSILN